MTKTALLTGGSRGIGAATVALLRERGWNVIAPTRAELDMGDTRIISSWMSDLEAEHLDALIFCHGEWYSKLPAVQSWVDYRAQYEARVIGPLCAMEFALSYMHGPRMTGGAVCMVSSTRGLIGGVNTGPYSAACAAQIALMLGYAREWPGVRFNALAVGLTDTDMGRQVLATGGAKAGSVPQPPGAVAAEIVRLVESDDNGRVMRVVDGAVSEAKWSW